MIRVFDVNSSVNMAVVYKKNEQKVNIKKSVLWRWVLSCLWAGWGDCQEFGLRGFFCGQIIKKCIPFTHYFVYADVVT